MSTEEKEKEKEEKDVFVFSGVRALICVFAHFCVPEKYYAYLMCVLRPPHMLFDDIIMSYVVWPERQVWNVWKKRYLLRRPTIYYYFTYLIMKKKGRKYSSPPLRVGLYFT